MTEKRKFNFSSDNIMKLCHILFGEIPPKKICPKLSHTIIYIIVMVSLIYGYGINKISMLNILIGFLLIVISAIIGIRMVFSYFFLVEKIDNLIKKLWYKAKWKYLYPNIENWLTVANIEKNKAYWVLNTLNKRECLKYTNSEYKKIKSENKVNGFVLYESLINDLSNLSENKLITFRNYIKDTKNNMDVYYRIVSKSLTSLPLFIIFLLGFLVEGKIKINTGKNIEETLDIKDISNIFIRVWNQGFIYQYFMLGGLLATIFILSIQFLSNRREIRTKAILVRALDEVINKKNKSQSS